jgi:hypothetical protein
LATNKTEFLNLNDWVGTDPFRREEINANFRALDAKAKEHDDEKADKSEVATLTTQLAQSASQIQTKGVNALYPPSPYVAAKADGTNDAVAINTLLQNFNIVVLPASKTYGIASSIRVPTGKMLYSVGGLAKLQLLTTNIAGVELEHLARVDGISVLLATGNTLDSACGFKLLTDAASARHFIGKVEVIGTDRTGNGVYMSDSVNTIAFSVIDTIYCTGVKNAYMCNMSGSAYANGVIVNNIAIRSSIRGFYLVGGEANVFNNIEWNTGSASVEAIYCNTLYNSFNGWFYDLGAGAYTKQLATFGTNATGNRISTPSTVSTWVITDSSDNKLNFLNTLKDDVLNVIKQASYLPNVWMNSTEYKKWGYWFDSKPYGGVQDNVFAYADKINTVTNASKALSSGTLGVAFDPFAGISTGKPTWNLQTGEQAQIKIDIANPTFSTKRLDFIQVVFSSALEARNVLIEGSIDNGTNWITLKNITGNDKRYVVFHDNLSALAVGGSNPTNIRITLSDPINASKDVRVEAIIGRMLAVPGYTFLPRGGGKVYGDIEFDATKGSIIKSPNGTRYRITVSDAGTLSATLA